MFKTFFRKAALKNENMELKHQNAVRADIISINAHQLRTSLTAMKWVMKMFMDRDLGPLTDEQAKYLDTCYDRNERMIKLVSEMLDVNRKGELAMEYDLKPASLETLVDEMLVDFKGETEKAGITLIKESGTTLPHAMMDSDRIRIVFQNLIENAIKYSSTGKNVTISLGVLDGKLHVTVRDQGIGISPEDQERIFGRYFRADNARQTAATGSGIGLFTTKRIIQAHGGEIWFQSKPNEGTAFHFTLPTAKATEAVQ